jgi:AAA+ ATPase superfamily predicted ATPase
MPDRQKRLMVELMNFFVAMTKESHMCHVIIASSDAFFIEQIYVDSKLRKTSQFMKLDYLEKDDVFKWLLDIRKYNKVKEYSLDREQIELIWDTVGGSAWEIHYILEQLFLYPLEEIVARIKREKTAMITDFIRRNRESERLLCVFTKTPVVSSGELFDFPDEFLGLLVKDNILYYDPVDGVYGIQGRSLEWGIRGYFGKDV